MPTQAAWHDHPDHGPRGRELETSDGCRRDTGRRMMEGVGGPQDELAEIDLTESEIDAMMAAGERVAVVAPPGAARQSVFIVYVDELNLYGWRLLSASGEVLATSRSYPTKPPHSTRPGQ